VRIYIRSPLFQLLALNSFYIWFNEYNNFLYRVATVTLWSHLSLSLSIAVAPPSPHPGMDRQQAINSLRLRRVGVPPPPLVLVAVVAARGTCGREGKLGLGGRPLEPLERERLGRNKEDGTSSGKWRRRLYIKVFSSSPDLPSCHVYFQLNYVRGHNLFWHIYHSKYK
jgi:hypothetical protein